MEMRMVPLLAVKLGSVISIAILWYQGGQAKGKWKRFYIIPAILGAITYLKYSLSGFILMFLACQSFRIGYGNYEPGEDNCWLARLTKDTNGWWVRLLWGLLVSVAISLAIVLSTLVSQN